MFKEKYASVYSRIFIAYINNFRLKIHIFLPANDNGTVRRSHREKKNDNKKTDARRDGCLREAKRRPPEAELHVYGYKATQKQAAACRAANALAYRLSKELLNQAIRLSIS